MIIKILILIGILIIIRLNRYILYNIYNMLHLLETNKYIITFVLTSVVIILGIYFLYYKKKMEYFIFKKKEKVIENYDNLSPSLATLLKNNDIKLEQYYNIIKYYNNIKKEEEVSITENTKLSDLELDTNEKKEITQKLQELNSK